MGTLEQRLAYHRVRNFGFTNHYKMYTNFECDNTEPWNKEYQCV